MPRYAAFLRAINVGGRRITNDELGECFAGMGLDNVSTYQAAGNVVLTSDEKDPRTLGERVEAGLEQALGYEVRTLLRDGEQLATIVEREPFDPERIAAKYFSD